VSKNSFSEFVDFIFENICPHLSIWKESKQLRYKITKTLYLLCQRQKIKISMNPLMTQTKVFIIIFYDIIFSLNMNLFAVLCCDELLVKIFADEEEVEQAERMANWAAIKDLVEEDANEKRKLTYSPGICQGPGQ